MPDEARAAGVGDGGRVLMRRETLRERPADPQVAVVPARPDAAKLDSLARRRGRGVVLSRLDDRSAEMRRPAMSIRNGCEGLTKRVKWSLLVSVRPFALNVRTRSMCVVSVPSGFVIVVSLN